MQNHHKLTNIILNKTKFKNGQKESAILGIGIVVTLEVSVHRRRRGGGIVGYWECSADYSVC